MIRAIVAAALGVVVLGGYFAVSASSDWAAPMREVRVWVDADQRTLLLSGTGSDCDTGADLNLTETPVAVRIEITRHGEKEDCATVGHTRTFKIVLSGLLGARRITGFNDMDLSRLDVRPDERVNPIPLTLNRAADPYIPPPALPEAPPAEGQSLWVDPSGTLLTLVDASGGCGAGPPTIRLSFWPRSVKITLRHEKSKGGCPATIAFSQYRVALPRPLGDRKIVGADGTPLPLLKAPPDVEPAGDFKIVYR